jgi:DNA repair protein RecO (recombination protein O)
MHGLVLRLTDYGESDQIASLFLREQGVISAIAKGIKRSKRRFPHHLEPFAVYAFTLSKKPSHALYFIRAADQVEALGKIADSIQKIALLHYTFELILAAVKEGAVHKELYDLVIAAFRRLCGVDDLIPIRFYLEIHMMRLLGFTPDFEACLVCKRPVKRGERNKFNPRRGGFLCEKCATGEEKPFLLAVTAESSGILHYLKQCTLNAALRIRISTNARREIAALLEAFITQQLEHSFKTLPLLNEVSL